MKALLIKLENMAGTSKRTGNEYQILKAFFLVEIPIGQTQKTTPDYVRTTVGYDSMECQIEQPLYKQIEKISEDGMLVPVELEFDTSPAGGQMRTQLVNCVKAK